MQPVAPRARAALDDLFLQAAATTNGSAAARSRPILDRIREFDGRGQATIEQTDGGIPYLVNEFWTSGQRQAHAIHEISYRACFKPQLPEFFIARLTEEGDAVHDPFMGRGTTPVQAALMRRRPLANDINPLSTLLTRPRLAAPNLADIAARLDAIPWNEPVAIREDLLVFYHPETLRQLCVLRRWLLERAPVDLPRPDPAIDWIRMIALNRLTGHSPGFFSRYTLPPNQAVGIDAQARINAKRNQTPPPRDIRALILKKSRALLADGAPAPAFAAILSTGPADRSPAFPDASAALVVTSPPFLDIVQYADDSWLRCWFAGIDASAIAIAMHRTERGWTEMVRSALAEQARIVRPGGHVAFEVGEVRGGKVLLERCVWEAAEGLPFERLAVVINQQAFTKTANCWGIRNNTGGTNTNRIVLLRRQ